MSFNKGVELVKMSFPDDTDNPSLCSYLTAIYRDEIFQTLYKEYESFTNELKGTMDERQLQLYSQCQSKAYDVRYRLRQIITILDSQNKELKEIISHSKIV